MRIFGKGKCKRIAKCEFLAKESVNSIANFSATMVTSTFVLSLSLSVSLSLSLSLLSHRAHLTHNVGSTSALPKYRQTDRQTVGPLALFVFSLRYACCYLREQWPVSLVVLAIRLALSFHCDTRAHTHTHNYCGRTNIRLKRCRFRHRVVGE